MTARTLPRISRAVRLALLGLVAFAGVGCKMLDKHREKKIPQYGYVDPNLPRELRMVSLPRHVVEPPDELEISTKPALSDLSTTTVTVQPDGFIDLGFLGHHYVSGLTLEEVELKLMQVLAFLPERKGAKDPLLVTVRLLNGDDSKRYYVLGSVGNPNSYPVTGNETVLDAILQAGLRSYSLPEKAYLVRPHPVDGEDQVFSIDWFGITERGDTMTNYQIMPGDRVYVPGGKPPGLLGTLLGGG